MEVLLGARNLRKWLKKLNLTVEDMKCAVCGEPVTVATLQFIAEIDGKIEFICRKVKCNAEYSFVKEDE